jgi:hypothetical protein
MASRRNLARVVVLALALALLAGSMATARIVPQRGMKGIRLAMTEREVRQKLGRPDRTVARRYEIMGRARLLVYGRTSVLLRAASSRVVSIQTTSRRERTSRGVGVGSTQAAVRRRVRGARCRTERGYRHCWVGTWLIGRRITDFAISRRGRVTRVTVGYVID